MRVASPILRQPLPDVLGGESPQRVGILSTYPATPCGLATFSAALARGIEANGAQVHIVRVLDGVSPPTPAAAGGVVVGEMRPGSPSSAIEAARLLNACDMVVVQHEYGLYGGEDGEDVLAVLAELRVPTIMVAHTVLQTPTSHQRAVLVAAADLADQVVVMSRAAHDRLLDVFAVDPAKVTIIPHGANTHAPAGAPAVVDRSTMLTWGLVGPGKGMERVIDVLPHLRRRSPTARYVIAGQTHPKVLASQGEAYRSGLAARARHLGVADAVHFDPAYRDVDSLGSLIRTCGVVVLPYDSTDQVTSGVLVDAVAAGRPVVATAFPHAVELLSSGAGIVVGHNDPDALELALARLLTRPRVGARMAAEAAKLAPSMGWPVVARSYLSLAGHLSGARRAMV
ncbi:MAG TPA: glycosyltransferase [Euzebya sp.]|nr:glycosyltransferase [Euzebya sp.]